MTNATRKTLVDVYDTLVRVGWGEPDDRSTNTMAAEHATPERPSKVVQSIGMPASHSPPRSRNHDGTRSE
jgi:hypothetical protein